MVMPWTGPAWGKRDARSQYHTPAAWAREEAVPLYSTAESHRTGGGDPPLVRWPDPGRAETGRMALAPPAQTQARTRPRP